MMTTFNWLHKLSMEQLHLVHLGLNVSLYHGLFEVLPRELVVIALAAILASGTPPGIRVAIGEVQDDITPQLGNEMQVALPHHM